MADASQAKATEFFFCLKTRSEAISLLKRLLDEVKDNYECTMIEMEDGAWTIRLIYHGLPDTTFNTLHAKFEAVYGDLYDGWGQDS